MSNQTNDYRQRFFIQDSPVRGDIVHLADSYRQITAQRPYPNALQKLLGEMLVAASLLIGTLKINGRLSIQLQHPSEATDEQARLAWAMAECDHQGHVRALADWSGDWTNLHTADEALATLGKAGEGVLFINVQPDSMFGVQSEGYQGIVERVSNNLAECLTHYQQQSVQIPTVIKLAADGTQAGGILLQLLPRGNADINDQRDDDNNIDTLTAAEMLEGMTDADLFPRLSILTDTLKPEELTDLPAKEILLRLYHEEPVSTIDAVPLTFACTCSREKSASAIFQLGKTEAMAIADEHGGEIALDCGFCGQVYRFNKADIEMIFA